MTSTDRGLHLVETAPTMRHLLADARDAQRPWAERSARQRASHFRAVRAGIAARRDELAASVPTGSRRSGADTLAAEVLPLADAARWIEREAPRLLGSRGRRGARATLLAPRRVDVARDPRGLVLVVGPSNYPLFLPGVQALHALAAGNAVAVKPGRGGSDAMHALGNVLREAGLPNGLFTVLPEDESQVEAAITAGVDLVVLTGSTRTGRQVLEHAARALTPAVVELSGCDVVFVREDADLELTARALRFGLLANHGATCIAPRRAFVHHALARPLERRLVELLAGEDVRPLPPGEGERVLDLMEDARNRGAHVLVGAPPDGDGMRPTVLAWPAREGRAEPAVLRDDVAAPLLTIVPVEDDEEALRRAKGSPFALGASVFGLEAGARSLAERVSAGVVVLNDMIAPTADPRVPFGGRGASGFGTTRGAEGLLAMTCPRAVLTGPRTRPHLDPHSPDASALLDASLRARHSASLRGRLGGLVDALRAMVELGRRTRARRRDASLGRTP